MNLELELQNIYDKYLASEGEDKAGAIQALKMIHVPLLRGNPEVLSEFIFDAIRICGGTYIPFIFWMELIKLLEGRPDRELIYEIIQEFVNSDFDETECVRMKPLLIIYFTVETQFQVDKIKAYIVAKSHPSVIQYFQQYVYRAIEKTPKVVEAYRQKLWRLKGYYPNFEMLDMPTSLLEQKLSAK